MPKTEDRPTSPFVSVFKFNIVTTISFLHRASEVLLFIALGCCCIVYGVESLSSKYPWLKQVDRIISAIISFLPVKFISFFGFWLLFFYTITEFRFILLDLKLLKMSRPIMKLSAIVVATLSILFPALFVWMFLL